MLKQISTSILVSTLLSSFSAYSSWSEFSFTSENISALVQMACTVNADKSASASHTDNGVYFHEYNITRESDGLFHVTGECRISVDQNMHRLAGEKISFVVNPQLANSTDSGSSILQGTSGDWMFRFYYGSKSGSQFDGYRLRTPKVISHMSFSTGLFIGSKLFEVPVVKSAIELMARTTDYQYTFQESTKWADSFSSEVSIVGLMDRTSGSILDKMYLKSDGFGHSEIRVDNAMGNSYGNGIFYKTGAGSVRGCTNLNATPVDVHFIFEEDCKHWWSLIH